eukprot:5734868-Prymnesium_polylepis.2
MPVQLYELDSLMCLALCTQTNCFGKPGLGVHAPDPDAKAGEDLGNCHMPYVEENQPFVSREVARSTQTWRVAAQAGLARLIVQAINPPRLHVGQGIRQMAQHTVLHVIE